MMSTQNIQRPLYFASAAEMSRLDEEAVGNGLTIYQMMELSGWHSVTLFQLLGISSKVPVVVAVGKGNNGGNGLSAARHLINAGWDVRVVLARTEVSECARHHLQLLQSMHVPVTVFTENRSAAIETIAGAGCVIDALLGYNLVGDPRDEFAELINAINAVGANVISYDVPSGLNAATGAVQFPCVAANITLALALPKMAFLSDEGKRKAGEVYVADLGIPAEIYDSVGSGSRPPFELFPGRLVPASDPFTRSTGR